MSPTMIAEDLYPSRIENQPKRFARKDPILYEGGDLKDPLTPEGIAQYERDGFLSLPGLFSDEEVAAYRTELKRLAALPGIREFGEIITEPESGDVRSIFNINRISDVYARLAADPRLLNVVQYLLADDVYIHQSRVNLKPGFRGKEFYWHSDFETWHVEDGMPRMRCMSASVALTENNEFNGPLMLIPGSHRDFVSCVGETPEANYEQSLKRQDVGVPDEDNLTRWVDEHGIQAPKGPAGSVTFFDCNTMHGSAGNLSPYPRSNVFFVFNAVSNAPGDPFSGQAPRPEHIANRSDFTPIHPVARMSIPYVPILQPKQKGS